ncbi:Heavy-metal-associated domain (N-terminus) and membrane-bounded cytochrome biogenesis cycZ-like domain, possible membrane copper tolerance protein [hydrothermal vent metagenome]|uniref:Heavy-metal-associated domain (N-terminus) and membrane-bounded cytochrome biogenesis cycZ-like domain, possible membrane copper tolerance protein n=1 Tax=hydrothermal vent metagenome TaxID=652676 RepID=A0A3B0WY59_9ZZZZ
MDPILITSLIVGFLGGMHCLGMCGGVVGALTFGLESKIQASWWRMLPYQVAYSGGRISSYIIIGALFGFLGASLGSIATFLPVQQALQLIAGLFMIALGLYLGGWWFGVVVIEKAGQFIWRRIVPYAQRLRSVKTIPQAWLYGMIWGWLPCGLVYSMLIMAMSAGNAMDGALIMLAFGLGTLPNLLLMGVFAFYFTRLARNAWVRRFAGLSVIMLGVWQLYLVFSVSLE